MRRFWELSLPTTEITTVVRKEWIDDPFFVSIFTSMLFVSLAHVGYPVMLPRLGSRDKP